MKGGNTPNEQTKQAPESTFSALPAATSPGLRSDGNSVLPAARPHGRARAGARALAAPAALLRGRTDSGERWSARQPQRRPFSMARRIVRCDDPIRDLSILRLDPAAAGQDAGLAGGVDYGCPEPSRPWSSHRWRSGTARRKPWGSFPATILRDAETKFDGAPAETAASPGPCPHRADLVLVPLR